MRNEDRGQFAELMADVMAFYGKNVSDFSLSVWWQACARWDLEQVRKALTAHAMDSERGSFPPKPSDIVRTLEGTHTDRSLIAWGKVLDATQRVGAYSTVVFDDGAIHAAIEDMGGWPKMCRTSHDELPFVQKRFCDTYRAYAGRPDLRYPAKLQGEHDTTNAAKGHASVKPTLVGNPEGAQAVLRNGVYGGKTQISVGQVLPQPPRLPGAA